jgi:hypothetical protein
MTASLRRALISAAFFATVLTCTAPLLAQTVFDGPPFSADPKALLAAAQKVDAKELNILYLLDEETISFEPDGRAKSVFRAIEYIVTEDGVEGAGTASAAWAPWYDDKPVITARVITKDGTVHTLDPKAITESTAEEEQDMFSDQRVLRAPLPGVAAGAIVERVITFEGRSPIAGGGKYGLFLLGGNVPFERQRLVIDAETSVAPRIVNKSGFEPVTTEQNGRKRVVFDKGHTDAFDNDEEYLPSDELNLPYVAFANGSSWHDIARNYSAIVDKQIATDGDLKSIVDGAIGTTTNRAEIIDRLLDMVEKNVRYAGVEVGDGSIVPRPPKSVLQKKYGDCKDKATLLVALLRTAGLPAHVALLDAGSGFDVIAGLPGVDRFNHAIVVVDGAAEGQPALWIDPTDEFARAGQLPPTDGADCRRRDGRAHAHTRGDVGGQSRHPNPRRHAAGGREGAHRRHGRGNVGRGRAVTPRLCHQHKEGLPRGAGEGLHGLLRRAEDGQFRDRRAPRLHQAVPRHRAVVEFEERRGVGRRRRRGDSDP